MPWATFLKNRESSKMVMLGQDQTPDSDDPRYGDEVHIVPIAVVKREDGEYYEFGIHDFKRDCYCHPKVQEQVFGRTLVIHKEMVN
jgi:hypothetical protein